MVLFVRYRTTFSTRGPRRDHRSNQANPDFAVTIREFDTSRPDAGSIAAAPAIAADPSVIAVIGPTFPDEIDLVGEDLPIAPGVLLPEVG